MSSRQRNWLLLSLTMIMIIAVLLFPPIPQPRSFHKFADNRSLWGIPNFANVASNLPFLIVGIIGLLLVVRGRVLIPLRITYWILFIGVFLTGLGSAYYHSHPNNDTLVWDRIPMTIVFMSLLSATISKLKGFRIGFGLLFPLVAIGIGSVLWWHYTETIGKGDLRLYMLVQFYPMLFIPLLLWLYYTPKVRPILRSLIWVVIWYVLAKVFEQWDYPIYRSIGISGHTLKHLAAAISTWYFVVLFRQEYTLPKVVPVAI